MAFQKLYSRKILTWQFCTTFSLEAVTQKRIWIDFSFLTLQRIELVPKGEHSWNECELGVKKNSDGSGLTANIISWLGNPGKDCCISGSVQRELGWPVLGKIFKGILVLWVSPMSCKLIFQNSDSTIHWHHTVNRVSSTSHQLNNLETITFLKRP